MFQWTSPNGKVSLTGGSMVYTNGDNGLKINVEDADNITGSTLFTILVDGQYSHQNDAVKSTASGRITVNFMDPLEKGDILTITGYQNNTLTDGRSTLNIEMGGSVFSEGDEYIGFWPNLAKGGDESASPAAYSFTIGDEWAGQTSMTLTLAEGEAPIYITEITVTRDLENVEMSRLIVCEEGYLNSFCYPYTVTCDEDVQFYYFDGIKNGYVYGTPVEGNVLEAGVPYLYVPNTSNITVERTDPSEYSVSSKHYHGIYGNYIIGLKLYGNQYKVLSTDGLVFCSDQGTTIKRYGCYFKDSEISRTYTTSAKAVCLSSAAAFFENAQTTGIDIINMAKANNTPVYNLSGQRVSTPQHGGVYIVNGKKVVMK